LRLEQKFHGLEDVGLVIGDQYTNLVLLASDDSPP
jgi:hypothetical protein